MAFRWSAFWRAYQPPEISEVEVRLPFLPKNLDGFRLIQLSDVHIGAMLQRKFLEELVARTNALRKGCLYILQRISRLVVQTSPGQRTKLPQTPWGQTQDSPSRPDPKA